MSLNIIAIVTISVFRNRALRSMRFTREILSLSYYLPVDVAVNHFMCDIIAHLTCQLEYF